MARCLCCWIVVLSHCAQCLGNWSWAKNGTVRGDVGLGRAESAILEGLVDGMECSAASRLLQVGCHSSDGVDLQVCVPAAAQLFGCFKGCSSVFGEVAEKGEGVQSSGGKEMWFVDGMLPSAKLAEKSLVGG